jgi:hypothetical protein
MNLVSNGEVFYVNACSLRLTSYRSITPSITIHMSNRKLVKQSSIGKKTINDTCRTQTVIERWTMYP